MTSGENAAMPYDWVFDLPNESSYSKREAILFLYSRGTSVTGAIRFTIRRLAAIWNWSKSKVGRLLEYLVGQRKARKEANGYVLVGISKKNGTRIRAYVGQRAGQKKPSQPVCKSAIYANIFAPMWDKERDRKAASISLINSVSDSYSGFSFFTPIKNRSIITNSINNNSIYNLKEINNNILKKQEKSSEVIHNEKNMKKAKKDYSESFKAFWEIALRKEEKAAAQKHYVKLVNSGVTEQQLYDKFLNYNKYHEQNKTEVRFVMKPFNWLSKGAYENADYEIKQDAPQDPLARLSERERKEHEDLPWNFKIDETTGFIRRKTSAEGAGLA